MATLGIIPARGGSKGIPRKNIKELGGKPLIAHTIQASLESGALDRVIVSTDDEEIAAVARQCGASVPFLRPQELATDTTPTLPVLVHAVEWLKEHEGFSPDITVILQPTTPLRQPRHIQESVDLLRTSRADSVVSMSSVPGHYNPHWQFKVDAENRIAIFTGESLSDIVKRRQDLPLTYTRNGAIYAFKTNLLFQDPPTFYGDDVRAYIMEECYSVNIDSEEDLLLAGEKLRQTNES